MADRAQRTDDLVEIHHLCARYMMLCAQFIDDRWLEVMTPDVEYSAFGETYSIDRFPALLAAAPRGQFVGSMPVVEFVDDDRATGMQHYVFIDQSNHAMRLAWYTDEYVRTPEGWRISKRSTTFMRKKGGYDAGIPHDPLADAAREGAGAK